MRNSRLFILSVFILFGCSVHSQVTDGKIYDSFNNVTLVEFFDRLEKKVPYKFYYNKSQLDSFLLRLDVKGQSLPELLEEAFKGTDILFAIEENNKHIYITRKLAVVTHLPKDIFRRSDNSDPLRKAISG